MRHPATHTWQFPPAPRSGDRLNLREMMARPARFEHHLVVLARAGGAQLECATASEPLSFWHRNCSDELAVALPTGDAMLDAFSGRTFVADVATGEHVARYRHGCLDLVLHPYGWLHWPGQLRPPWEPFAFGPGMRRRGLTLVFCATREAPPPPDRPLGVTPGREADAKADRAGVPLLLAALRTHPPGVAGRVAGATLELLDRPARVAPPQGGYLVVLDAAGDAFFPCDVAFVAPGAALPTPGVARALLFHATTPAEPPPPTWSEDAAPPFAVFEDAPPGALPITIGALTIAAHSGTLAAAGPAQVPRYWLARQLYREALHGTLGYTETYGGFFLDDTAGDLRLGVRGGPEAHVPRGEALATLERLYRAVAPPGYRERLS